MKNKTFSFFAVCLCTFAASTMAVFSGIIISQADSSHYIVWSNGPEYTIRVNGVSESMLPYTPIASISIEVLFNPGYYATDINLYVSGHHHEEVATAGNYIWNCTYTIDKVGDRIYGISADN